MIVIHCEESRSRSVSTNSETTSKNNMSKKVLDIIIN